MEDSKDKGDTWLSERMGKERIRKRERVRATRDKEGAHKRRGDKQHQDKEVKKGIERAPGQTTNRVGDDKRKTTGGGGG